MCSGIDSSYVTGSPFDIPTTEVDVVDAGDPPGMPECVVGQNPLTGVDRQHESREARSLYLSALQLARALRLRFIGRAT
jgi:hypothetical protein